MRKSVAEILEKGHQILDPIMTKHGFVFKIGDCGPSSGGPYARGCYLGDKRKLDLSYRHSLGLVTYHYEQLSLQHESYMRAILGNSGGNRYPTFSDDPAEAFTGLSYDLEHFCDAFLTGDFVEFRRCVSMAAGWNTLSGLARLAQSAG